MIGSHYSNEVAALHSPVPLPLPLAAPAAAVSPSGMAWKAGCDDAVMMSCQLPQHYTYYSNVLRLPSDHSAANCHTAHCKTSLRRRNTERHKDRVMISFYIYIYISLFTIIMVAQKEKKYRTCCHWQKTLYQKFLHAWPTKYSAYQS